MQTESVLHPANGRGHVKIDWLESNHSFSFSSYYDPQKMGFGALRVINDDIIAANQGFGTHGHQDMEIITIPLQGSVLHRDSLGTEGTVDVGEVQLMAAGTGIRHSEHNPEGEALKLFQIWIHPRQLGLTPSYQQMTYELEPGKPKWLVSPAKEFESQKTLVINQNAYVGIIDLGNESIKINTPEQGLGTYILNIEGSLSVNKNLLQARDAFGHWEEQTHLAGEQGSKALIFHVPKY